MPEDLPQELPCSSVLRRIEEFLRDRRFHDFTVIHEYDTVSYRAGKAHLVGDANHGHSFPCQLGHRIENFLDHFRIK